MEIVKKYETSVPAFLFYLFTKAAYRLNKEHEEENVLARITADVRKILGIPHSQLNCSLAAHLSLKYDDLKEENLPNALKALKANIRNQLQPDVVKTPFKLKLSFKAKGILNNFPAVYRNNHFCGIYPVSGSGIFKDPDSFYRRKSI